MPLRENRENKLYKTKTNLKNKKSKAAVEARDIMPNRENSVLSKIRRYSG